MEGWNGRQPLVIDPLIFSTFLGAGENRTTVALTLDGAEHPYASMAITPVTFPITPGSNSMLERAARGRSA